MNLCRTAIALTLLATTAAFAQSPELPAKENFHLFLLAGQSNMAGRGEVEDVDRTPHPRVLTLNEAGEWVPAADPIHFDKPVAGVGPGKTFGEVVAEATPGVTIGLIPCAIGGSPIESWLPGAFHESTERYPYDEAIARTKRAMQDGTLKAILWHQGEGDAVAERAFHYEERLLVLFERFREQFANPQLPILIGQLGRFEDEPWQLEKEYINGVHQRVANRDPHADFVPAQGLTPKPDNVHFDAASARELGRRYAEAYLETIAKARP